MVINSDKFKPMGEVFPAAFLGSVNEMSLGDASDIGLKSHLPFVYRLLEEIRILQEENIHLKKDKKEPSPQPTNTLIWNEPPSHSWK